MTARTAHRSDNRQILCVTSSGDVEITEAKRGHIVGSLVNGTLWPKGCCVANNNVRLLCWGGSDRHELHSVETGVEQKRCIDPLLTALIAIGLWKLC